MRLEVAKLLFDASSAGALILEAINGKSFEDFQSNHILRAAVERYFMIVGEALAQLRAADPEAFSLIPDGYRAVGPRNVLVHGYSKVDSSIVWSTAQHDLPAMTAAIDDLLKEAP